jgi:hypothetical protein
VDSRHDYVHASALGELSAFWQELYALLTARPDGLFELTDAALCAHGPVTTSDSAALASLSLSLPLAVAGRIVLAENVSPRLRAAVPTGVDRLFCLYGWGKGNA